MKKLIYSLMLGGLVLLAGCFETTQEITINKDGTGVFKSTTDLSSLLGLLKQMGGDDTAKIKNTDTTILLSNLSDSITGLTPRQKKIINQGSMNLTLNMQDEKLLIKLNLPFQKIEDLQILKEAVPKISAAVMNKLPGTDQVPGGMGGADTSKIKSFDNFFDVTFSDKLMLKTLNKEKYASGKDGDYMKSLQQLSGMGSPVKANYIINLPHAAKKVEGKAAKLSDDKKQITIAVTSDDFFNDPSKFEYRIEY
ncbi:MAG TPA: hypothetical protein VK588_07490 [Chitinophagaceae bacterium]|nr:hypothetical protein [Chitinophagaceae bacterium]